MLKSNSEKDQLKYENVQLKSDLARANQELKALKLNLRMVQESRDSLETQISEIVSENEELKTIIDDLERRLKADTPILNGTKTVQFEECPSEVSIETENSQKLEEEPENFAETGPDFDSKWRKNISISKSHPDYIVLKNNSKNKHESLDDFLFTRIVDGVVTVHIAALPLGIVLSPMSDFTVHANHPGARQIEQQSCILHRFTTFGSGKVTENRILDENGIETANYVLCVFQG